MDAQDAPVEVDWWEERERWRPGSEALRARAVGRIAEERGGTHRGVMYVCGCEREEEEGEEC